MTNTWRRATDQVLLRDPKTGEEAGTVEGEPEEFAAEVSRQLVLRVQEVLNRRPSPEELSDRFAQSYLHDRPVKRDEEQDELSSIMAELQTHPKWDKHVRLAYNGNHAAAVLGITAKWRETKEKSNRKITPGSFAHFYRSHTLDELRKDRETETGDTTSALW